MSERPRFRDVLQVQNNDHGLVLTITKDGRVIPGEGMTMDQSAVEFLQRCSGYVVMLEEANVDLRAALAAATARAEAAISLLDDGINACRGFDDDGRPLTSGPFPCESFCENHGHHTLREIRAALTAGSPAEARPAEGGAS